MAKARKVKRRPPFGYSPAEISAAIRYYTSTPTRGRHVGASRDVAIAKAYRDARDAFRRSHPRGPMLARLRPERTATAAELAEHRRRAAAARAKIRRNPSAAPSARAQLREAISRFTGFRAQPPGRVDRGRIAAPGKVVFALGRVLMIGYSTVRAGRRFDYAHEFKVKARPLLVASSDGRNLFLLGGAYRVSNDGIVDTL